MSVRRFPSQPTLFAALPTLLFLFLSLSARGQDFDYLFARFRQAAVFDHNFPREKVYVHLDNNSYFEGETLWFKAYVVRASSLCPANLSRVLYVELLNADGVQVERKQLRIDSLGQAHGEFQLDLPIKAGFYELRAYTREMVNWGTEACFSRVVPVFGKPHEAGDFSALTIRRPETEQQLAPSHPRTFLFGGANRVTADFFPEGGQRAGGMEQRIAYKLTDGRGKARTDSLFVYDDAGQLIGDYAPVHDGMGFITLPAASGRGYVRVGKEGRGEKFDLPAPEPAVPYVLHANPAPDGVEVLVSGGADAAGLLGLAVTCRGRVCYFDTLTVGEGAVELFVPNMSLHDGVNHIALFDKTGRTYCSRLVWKNSLGRDLSLTVRQNAESYEAFSPIALEMNLKDKQENPVQAVFSMSVRDDAGELVRRPGTDLSVDMLLSSELKGYVHAPEYYFEADDAPHRYALDLLLAVQGWSANTFAQMCGRDSFELPQPIEDKLTLNGRVLRDNNKEVPYPGLSLNLKMYSRAGGALEGSAVTDSLGAFAFVSNVDYVGDWIAQITTKNENGKRKWSRVVLDRWFNVAPRTFGPDELNPLPPSRSADAATDYRPELFAWRDTIPHLLSSTLGEAHVIAKGKYRGFTGNRYTYNGGEHSGMKYADIYYNIEREVELMKDRGRSVGLIWDLLDELNSKFRHTSSSQTVSSISGDDTKSSGGETSVGLQPATTEEQGRIVPDGETFDFNFGGNSAVLFVDNVYKEYADDIWADEVKSVVIMTNPNAWRRFMPSEKYAALQSRGNRPEYAVFLYSRPDYALFKTRRGTDKRIIQGYAQPKTFYQPDYRSADLPDMSDVRRTLYWNPSVSTDAAGRASAVFFGNARDGLRIRISVRGITQDGRFVSFDQ